MKKAFSIIIGIIFIFSAIPSFATALGKTYYISSVNGNDSNDGLSADSPFKSVTALSGKNISSGDKILFKSDEIFTVTEWTLTCSGADNAPITISSYGIGNKPILTTNENKEVLRLFDCSYLTVSNLEIIAPNGGGIWIDTLNAESKNVTLTNLTMHNIQNTVATSRDSLNGGAAPARACVMIKGLPARSRYAVTDLTITNCEMYDCGNGISAWGSWNDMQNPWCEENEIDPIFNTGLYIANCYFHDMDAEALIIGMCDGAICEYCRCINCCQNDGENDDGTSFCNAAMWFWGSVNSVIRHCEIAGQKTVTDGMTCDFDSYTNHCTYEYIYSHDNVRFVNNCPQHSGHHGNTIRFCLSVNDNKRSNNLSQYCYNSNEWELQFYNNTIINPSEYIIEGVRDGNISQNIFYGDFTGSFRWARKKTDSETKEKYIDTFSGIMDSNCFWGTCVPACAENNFICDPEFVGNDFSNPDSFKLSGSSPLLNIKTTLFDETFTDIYGNDFSTSKNIGCYQGEGEKNAQNSNFLTKVLKFFSTIFAKAYQLIVDINNKYLQF